MTTVLVVAGPLPGRLSGRSIDAARAPLSDLRSDLDGIVRGVTVEFRQTDDEAQLISWLFEAVDRRWGVVLDPAAFNHYSYALRDAAALVVEAGLPLIEVHPTKPGPGDATRASVVSALSTGVIAGLGLDSYRFAVEAAAGRLGARSAQ
jgi:3-dehydroquinate dehydratase-2